MTIGKENALGRQPINVRRFDFLRAVTAEISLAHVIGENEQNVGWWLFGFRCCGDSPSKDCRNTQKQIAIKDAHAISPMSREICSPATIS